jgi:hypothetical protein
MQGSVEEIAVGGGLVSGLTQLVREGIRKGNKDSGNKDSGNKDSGNKDSGNKDSGNKDSGNKDSGNKDLGIADPEKQEWTMTHAFYADMGGFMLCVKEYPVSSDR